MTVIKNVDLSQYSSFGTGGTAKNLIEFETSEDLIEALKNNQINSPVWFLGSGTNVLISDKGLPGTTIRYEAKDIKLEGNLLIADAGAWWDDVVELAVENKLWGIELMSGIPGSTGAAVVGNIAAYGMAIADTLKWVEVIDLSSKTPSVKRLTGDELDFSYRYSKFQTEEFRNLLIIRAAFELGGTKTKELEYFKAIEVANELEQDINDISSRRAIILETRSRGGALVEKNNNSNKSAGSFFRNPMVSAEQAQAIMEFEENNVSSDSIRQMNKIHGGDEQRVSAAHVMLAAGFKRGQTWGDVRLHPDHILKIENIGNATSQDIYNVAKEIQATVKQKLGVELVAEVRHLGEFN